MADTAIQPFRVEISPATTTRPVVISVSQATRPVGSSRRISSRMASEIWSAILSGWPSVTDSDVNRYRFATCVPPRKFAPRDGRQVNAEG